MRARCPGAPRSGSGATSTQPTRVAWTQGPRPARARRPPPRPRRQARGRRTRRRRRARPAARRRDRPRRPRASPRPRARGAGPARGARPRRPGRRGDPLGAEPDHVAVRRRGPRLQPRSSSRATSRSSNGIFRPPSNSCPCSWPLPAITTVSPGSAASSAIAIAARRSGSTSTCAALGNPVEDLGDDRVRVLGARVVGGDDADVGQLGPDAAHQRALLAVAVAAAAEDADQPAAGDDARRAQDVLERVGRVRVVDEHREGLALVHGLEAPRNALRPRKRAAAALAAGSRARSPRPARRARSRR